MKVNDPFDPAENIRGGSNYLRLMLDQFSGNLDLAWRPTTLARMPSNATAASLPIRKQQYVHGCVNTSTSTSQR